MSDIILDINGILKQLPHRYPFLLVDRVLECHEGKSIRAIKNVTDAIKMRAMDIELPDVWFETPQAFVHKSYDEKKAMIAELRGPVTMEMILQEINRYADSEFRYADKSDDAAVTEIIRRERQRERAIGEIEKMKGEGMW